MWSVQFQLTICMLYGYDVTLYFLVMLKLTTIYYIVTTSVIPVEIL